MTPCWFVIRADALAELLRRAAEGESPDLLVVELAANSDTERVD